MKSSKIVLIALSLLLCATAKAHEPVSSDSQSPSVSARYYDPIHPEYAGTLSIGHLFTDLIYLADEVYVLVVIFSGNANDLYTLYVDSTSHGSHAYVDTEGLHEYLIPGNGLVQLTLEHTSGTPICNWRIFKYIED